MVVYQGNEGFLSQDVYTYTMSDIDISTNPSLEESVVSYLKDFKKTK